MSILFCLPNTPLFLILIGVHDMLMLSVLHAFALGAIRSMFENLQWRLLAFQSS